MERINMSQKERLEDLGRIRERLDRLSSHHIFEWKEQRRTKDIASHIIAQGEEKIFDTINSMAYDIDEIHHEIYEILSIATGAHGTYERR